MRVALRTVRLRASLTDAELARRTGLKRASYTNIENGHRGPSLATALRIARVLNEPVEQLFVDDVSSDEPVRERARVRGGRC
jgi:putative transcriptional regulator